MILDRYMNGGWVDRQMDLMDGWMGQLEDGEMEWMSGYKDGWIEGWVPC